MKKERYSEEIIRLFRCNNIAESGSPDPETCFILVNLTIIGEKKNI